jgi:hypothetical protein
MKWVASLLPLLWGFTVFGQVNSWVSPTGGDWHDVNSWSAGVLPGTNQTILITNANSKTVRIGAGTLRGYPDTLQVGSVTVSAPSNSINTLLLDAALTNTPFSTAGLNIGEGGILAVLGTFSQSSRFDVAGSVMQGQLSEVTVGDLELHDGGIYHLTNGTLRTTQQNIRSQAAFNQYGGSNLCRSAAIDGIYNISGGQLQARFHHAVNSIVVSGALNQSGGVVDGALLLRGWQSHYNLSGGLRINGPTIVGSGPGYPSGHILQTGGTNQGGEIRIVPYIDSYGQGWDSSYTLADGEVRSTIVAITPLGTFAQYGGRHVAEIITASSRYVCKKRQPGAYPDCAMACGRYLLYDGDLQCGSISGASGVFSQGGGRLTADRIEDASFSHDGGQLRVNHLVAGAFRQAGGELIVTNITVNGFFHDAGGRIDHHGWIEFLAGSWNARAALRRLGPVKVHGVEAYGEVYAPSIVFSTNSASVLHFSESRLSWTAKLIIKGWDGSFSGGGMHQLRFGNDNRGLQDTQVSQVWFENPNGIPGLYAARMLEDGEVVPLPVIVTERRGNQLFLHRPPGFVLQTSTNVHGPFEDVPAALSASPFQIADPARFFRLVPETQ